MDSNVARAKAKALINGLEVEHSFCTNFKVTLIPDRVSELGLKITALITYANGFLNLHLEGLSMNVVLTGNTTKDADLLAEMIVSFVDMCVVKWKSTLKLAMKDCE